MTADLLELRWYSQAAWARAEAARLHPSSLLHKATDQTQLVAAIEMLRDARAKTFLELSTGTRQPSLAEAAGWLAGNLELDLVPMVAKAIWITQGCPDTPREQSTTH
jgi:hypothetical protein